MGQSIEDGGDPARPFKVAAYYDANVFADITRSVRLVASDRLFRQRYVDLGQGEKRRFEIAGLFSSDSL
jgi:hypothetical protein